MPRVRAHKEHRKLPFLKALVKHGTISRAAREARISRDAVHDWRRNDPSFERAFQHAKRTHEEAPFETVDASVVFFKDVVRPLIPQAIWPSVCAELAIASTNLKRDLKEGGPAGNRLRRAVPTGETAEVSLSLGRRKPEGFEDVGIPNRDRGTSAQI